MEHTGRAGFYFRGCKKSRIGQNASKFSSNIRDILLKFASILSRSPLFSLRGNKSQHALVEKAKKIRLLILDVDGVLTNGTLYYGPEGLELKGFNIYDGLGIKLLQKTGVIVAIISAKKSEALIRRLKEINIDHAFLGQEEKLAAYEELKQKLKMNDDEIAYIGDDLPDLPLIRRVGFSISVPKAPEIIHEHVDFITKKKGGKGAVRELVEFIMKAQGTYETVIQSYLTK